MVAEKARNVVLFWCCNVVVVVFVMQYSRSLIQINLIKYALHYEMGQRFIYFSRNCLNSKQEINIEGLNERGSKTRDSFLLLLLLLLLLQLRRESKNARI